MILSQRKKWQRSPSHLSAMLWLQVLEAINRFPSGGFYVVWHRVFSIRFTLFWKARHAEMLFCANS